VCQQKYYYQEVLQIEPDVPIFRPLFFGKIVHDCLECWHNYRDINIVMNKVAQHYQGQEPAEQILAEVMLKAYSERYPREDFIIVESERTFETKFGDPDNPRKKKYLLGGRRDMVIRTDMDPLLMEHKTARTVDSNYIDKLPTDHQICLYGATYPTTLSGCLYNVLIKPYLKVGENLDHYRERLENLYATKDMFQRINIWWTDSDFYWVKKHTYWLLKSIDNSRRTNVFIRNTGMCFYYQRKCAYYDLCRNPENAQFIIESNYRARPEHAELTEGGENAVAN
jgi:hypothetical protein